MRGDYISLALYALCGGFWIGVWVERRYQQRQNGNAADVGRWLSKAILHVHDTHKFAGDLSIKNIGRIETKAGETFLVTVEREGPIQ